MSDRSTLGLIRGALDRRRVDEADIRFAVYDGPVGARGLHRITLPGSDQMIVVGSSLGGETFRPGSLVPVGSHSGQSGFFVAGSPPPGLRGASGFSLSRPLPGQVDVLTIQRSEPATVISGQDDQEIQIFGLGFLEVPLDSFRAVRRDPATRQPVADPWVTVHGLVWVSRQQVTLLFDVAPEAPAAYPVSLEVSRV